MAHNKAKEVTASPQIHAAKPFLVLLHGTSGFSEDWSGVAGSLPENRVVMPWRRSHEETRSVLDILRPRIRNQ